MKAPALTCRSYFSLLRGAVSPQRWAQTAHAYGYRTVALADVNALYGIVAFYQAAQKVGIKPILGAEILTDWQRIILLIENDRGYRNLSRLISAYHLHDDFDLTEQLQCHHQGLIGIVYEKTYLPELARILPRENLFFGCRDKDDIAWARQQKAEPIAANDFNTIDQDDIIRMRMVNQIRQLSTDGPGPSNRCGRNVLPPEPQWRQRFRRHKRALTNAQQVAERCEFSPITRTYQFPKVSLENERDGDSLLARTCYQRLPRKFPLITETIIKRLEHELKVIRENRFNDYFLVVKEIVDFAKSRQIPVEIRGSAAGSLVAYLLGFTRVCPLAHELYFERFMHPGRKDCPDIDIDLCWRGRDEVIRFCYDHWGAANVAMISTMNTYRLKGAIRDVGRYLNLPPHQIDELVRQRRNKSDSVVLKLAHKLIGTPRHVGIHCGGIVITPRPLHDLAPLQLTNKGVVVTQYEKDAAEALGLIKIDLLGNRALSTVNEAMKLIQRPPRPAGADQLDIDAIDHDDAKTARMLTAGRSLGIFQCESPGMRQLLQGIKIRNLQDVLVALSLIRPGPAAGGMKKEYLERHLHHKPFTYLHPRLQKMLHQTHGVMLFQEDIMKLAVEVAGYTLAEAGRFRSEVSKKVSSTKLQQQYHDFIHRKAARADIDRSVAEQIWEQILQFSAYSYCKAHAAVYANIAWQGAFLKAHYPCAFYVSLLNNHHGMYPLRVYVWEAIRQGIKVLLPHVNHSDHEWTLQGPAIRAGLGVVRGLSLTSLSNLIEQRRIEPFVDLDDLRRRVTFRHGELQNLIHLGACDGLGPTRSEMLLRIQRAPGAEGQLQLFDPYQAPAPLPAYSRAARIEAEIAVTGIPFSAHPAVFLGCDHVFATELDRYIDQEVTVVGFIATGRTAQTETGKTMGFITIEDGSGLVEISFFPEQLSQYRSLITAAGPIWITGRVSSHLSTLALECRRSGPVKVSA